MYWAATYYLFSVNEFIFTQSAAGLRGESRSIFVTPSHYSQLAT